VSVPSAGDGARSAAPAWAGLFLFGLAMALLGAVLPLLSERLRFDLAQAGTLFLAMNAAILVASLALGPLMDRFGTKPPLTVGPVLVAVALARVATAGDFRDLLWGVAVLGLGGGALNSAGNTLVAGLHEDPRAKSAALNLLGVFYGIGALFIPFVIGLLLQAVGLPSILGVAALLCLVAALHAGFARFPAPGGGDGLVVAEIGRLLRTPFVLAFSALLFFESGNEFILGGYVSTYLADTLGMGVRAASYALAGYWAALMLARAALSRMARHVPGPRLVLVCAAAAALGAGLLATASGPATAVPAFLLTGAALAGVFPTVLGIAAGEFPTRTGTVFGILFTLSLLGGMSLPWLAGQIAAVHGLRPALSLVALQFLAVVAFQAIVSRLIRARERRPPRSD
jgi:MFS transporter, FHS family, glucose/mannose:H+ symporter